MSDLEKVLGKAASDAKGAMGIFLAYLGDQAGVYSAMKNAGFLSATELSTKCGIDERYLLEFLRANAGHGYVEYDAEADKFGLSEAQAAVFASEGAPTCLQGFFQAIVSQYATHEKALETFVTGKGRPWGEHSSCLFCGTDRVFRPGYEVNLLPIWIPALQGVEEKLIAGINVADIGCGRGSSTIMMAKKYPKSHFYGSDFHAPSIEGGRKAAADAGITNVTFEVSAAKELSDRSYGLVCIFDAIHDMGDPVGCAKHIREIMSKDGTFMCVEPYAEDTLAENLQKNPKASLMYSFSTLVCIPTSKAQEVQAMLGAQAGFSKLNEVLNEAGFTSVRKACQNPNNMVIEARA